VLIAIFFFFDSCFAFVILCAGAGLLRATAGLLGGLSAELEAGLDGGWAGDLDLAFSEVSGPGFAGTLDLIAWPALFFLGLLEDSDANAAWRSSPRGASVGGDGNLSALWLRSLDSLDEDLGV